VARTFDWFKTAFRVPAGDARDLGTILDEQMPTLLDEIGSSFVDDEGVVLGDLLYGSAADTWSRLAGNITATRKFLRQTGTGTVSAAPAWDTILLADLPGFGTAGAVLRSTGSAWARSTFTIPDTVTLGGVPYGSASNVYSVLAGQITITRKFLSQTGDGAASAAPAWNQPAFTDVTSTLAYAQLPTGGGTWANGGALSITGGVTTVAGLVSTGYVGVNNAAPNRELDVVGGVIFRLDAAGSPSQTSGQFRLGGDANGPGYNRVIINAAPGAGGNYLDAYGNNAYQLFHIDANPLNLNKDSVGLVKVWGALAVVGAATFASTLISTTAVATPSALSATQFTAFASTVSGAAIMGFGTTNDVALMNRAGTVVLGVGPNTTVVSLPQGWLLVGPTSVSDQGYGAIQVQVEGLAGNTSKLTLRRNTDSSAPPVLLFAKSRGTAYAAVTTVQTGDTLGEFDFYGADGTSFIFGASVAAFVGGTVGTGDVPAYLSFLTRPQGGAGAVESLRVGFGASSGLSGSVGMASGQKFYPDGVVLTGDTFFFESSVNVWDFHAGDGTNYRLRIDGSTALSDGHTNLLVNRKAAGSEARQRVQWKDGGSIVAGDKVMILAA